LGKVLKARPMPPSIKANNFKRLQAMLRHLDEQLDGVCKKTRRNAASARKLPSKHHQTNA
jgi:hypothetical protein